jgi:glycosyltransferase involved in cell wall biosynthesis
VTLGCAQARRPRPAGRTRWPSPLERRLNRIITRNVDGLTGTSLPPLRREGPVRALFVTFDWVGWRTYGRVLAEVTAQREDFDAVHLRYWGRGLWRALSTPVPPARGWLASESRRLAVAAWRLRRWTRRHLPLERFDVVHVAPHKYAAGLVAATASSGTPLSVVLDATTFQERGELVGQDAQTVRRWHGPVLQSETSVMRAADLVVAMSGWAADGVRRDHGLPDERIEVLPPCVPAPDRRADFLSPGDVGRPIRLVFVGNDWDRKGGPRLLSWHQRFWADKAELHVCSSRAPADRNARNVVWHGGVENERLVRQLLPGMDVMVLPTTNDMSPHALVEAASLGLPVVSSSLGGIGELVCSDQTGFLIDPTDDAGFVRAVDRLVEDATLRRNMGEAALELFGRRLDAAVVGNRLLDRLATLAGRH